MICYKFGITSVLLMCAFSTLARADVIYTWTHDGQQVDGTDIVNTEIGFQIETSVDGGPLAYIDVAPGAMGMTSGAVSHTDPMVVMCNQVLAARVRALWGGKYSDWSAHANATAPDCPAPSDPENLRVTLP